MPIEHLPNEGDSQDFAAAEPAEALNRREIAKKAGKFLAYTAPALVTLLTARDANAY